MNNKCFFFKLQFLSCPFSCYLYFISLPSPQRLANLHFTTSFHLTLCAKKSVQNIISFFRPWSMAFLSLQLLSQEVGPTLSSTVICLPLPWCAYCTHHDLASHLLINGEQNKRASVRNEEESTHKYLEGRSPGSQAGQDGLMPHI